MMKASQILILITLFSVVSITVGLSTNYTEWRKDAQMHDQSRDQISMEVVQNKTMDDETNTSNEKKSLDYHIVMPDKIFLQSNTENNADYIVKFNTEPKLPVDKPENILEVSTKDAMINKNFNVVLFVVADLDKISAFNLEIFGSFPVQRYLKTCTFPDFIHPTFSPFCDCDNLLMTNIDNLLSWARNTKGMVTYVFHEIFISKRNYEWDIFKTYMNSPMLNNEKKNLIIHEPKTVKKYGFIAIAEVVDKYELEDEFSEVILCDGIVDNTRKGFIRKIDSRKKSKQQRIANFVKFATGALEDVQKVSNENGYVLVMMSGNNIFDDVLKLIINHVPVANTLFVVTSKCGSESSRYVPFFARGSNSQRIINIMTESQQVYELPNALRSIMSDNEYGDSGNSDNSDFQDHEEVIDETAPSDLEVNGYSEKLFNEFIGNDKMEVPLNRFARHEPVEVQSSEKSNIEKNTKEKIGESQKMDERNVTKINVIEKKDANVKEKSVSNKLDIALRLANDLANNCHKITSYSALIVAEILMIVTNNIVLKF